MEINDKNSLFISKDLSGNICLTNKKGRGIKIPKEVWDNGDVDKILKETKQYFRDEGENTK